MTTSTWIGNIRNLSDGLACGLLTGEEHHCASSAQCPHLTREREQYLVGRARAGDAQAVEELVTSLLRRVECNDSRYYNGYAKSWQRLEYLALVSNLVVALEQPNPCTYLLATARGAIQRYCSRNRSSIRTPEPPGVSPVIVESLDIPLCNGEGQTLLDVPLDAAWGAISPASDELDYTALHQAIDALPTMQRTVTLRHYGLRDAPPEGVEALNQALYGKQHKMGYVHRRLALARLRGMLAPAYPQYTQERATHLHPDWTSPTLHTLTLTQEQQQRLERALRLASQEGEDHGGAPQKRGQGRGSICACLPAPASRTHSRSFSEHGRCPCLRRDASKRYACVATVSASIALVNHQSSCPCSGGPIPQPMNGSERYKIAVSSRLPCTSPVGSSSSFAGSSKERKRSMARRKATTLPMPLPGARLLTIPEVMATLGVGRTKVYDLIKRGGLPYIHLDGSTRVWETSLRQWIAQHERRNIPA